MRNTIKTVLRTLGLIIGSIVLGNLQLMGFASVFQVQHPLIFIPAWLALTGLLGYGTLSVWKNLNEEPKD